jgi:hypothetical protein
MKGTYHRHVALVLVAAFTLSLAYTIYTTATGLTPTGYNAVNPVMWLFYLLGYGTALLAWLDRPWAWWVVAVMVLGFLAVGILVYPPTFTPELQDPLGWFENDVYMGLLIVAEYLTIQRLRRVSLTP